MKVAARDLVRNVVKEKLARDEVALSMTVRLVRTAEIVTIAKTAGFDTFYIDLEHSSLSIETASQICMTAMNAGIAPFVRLPNLASDVIARNLDGGALGVIAPHVESAEQQSTSCVRRNFRRWANARMVACCRIWVFVPSRLLKSAKP